MVVVIGAQVYQLARRAYGMSEGEAAFMLGLLGLVQFIPFLLLTPLAGVLADRMDRRYLGAMAHYACADSGWQLQLRAGQDQPLDRAMEIARLIANKNPHAIRAAKRLAARMPEADTDTLLMEESREQHAIIRSKNQVEAVMAEMERRKPQFQDG